MRLVQADGRIRLVTNKTAQDHTTRMRGYARRRVEELAYGELCGLARVATLQLGEGECFRAVNVVQT